MKKGFTEAMSTPNVGQKYATVTKAGKRNRSLRLLLPLQRRVERAKLRSSWPLRLGWPFPEEQSVNQAFGFGCKSIPRL